jgi:hypothetical protein
MSAQNQKSKGMIFNLEKEVEEKMLNAITAMKKVMFKEIVE